MAQAETVTTKIRELMSRGQPPKSTSAHAAHTEFVAAPAGNAPHSINPKPNSADLQRCADHLEKVFAARQVHITAILADFALNIPGSILDRRYLDQLFQQFSADALGVIRNAVPQVRAPENWGVS